MRMRVPAILLLALACGACAMAGSGARPSRAAEEQAVLMMIIAEQGRGAVLRDSTWGHRCAPPAKYVCPNPGAPADVWAGFIQASSEPAALRDLLPPGFAATYTADIGNESALPCERRRSKLQLSRVGFSADGSRAVVSYTHWRPMNHLGCGAVAGQTVLLRRERDGTWTKERPLSSVVS